jgi:hypothetical protein
VAGIEASCLCFHQWSIYWKIPNPQGGGGGKISADVIWGKKYENMRNKKKGNVKKEERGKKKEERGRKGKENEKRRSKRVK